jgi:bifunctional DNA-binding transcriptional regulator/antitoxin component of YhaV-PrlF toxin-antitoxin module
MSTGLRTVKITRKGQVTLPRRIRDFLKSDVIEFAVIDDRVVVIPVDSAAGSLSEYAKEHVSVEKIESTVWKEAINAKYGKKTS